MDGARTGEPDELIETDLVDATGLSLQDLDSLDSPQLRHALQRLLRQRREPAQVVVAGHSNAMP